MDGGLWKTCWIRHAYFSMVSLHTYGRVSREIQITSPVAAKLMACSRDRVAQRGEPQSEKALLLSDVWHSRPRLCIFTPAAIGSSRACDQARQNCSGKEKISAFVVPAHSPVLFPAKTGKLDSSGRDLLDCDRHDSCLTFGGRLQRFNSDHIDHKHRRGRLCHTSKEQLRAITFSGQPQAGQALTICSMNVEPLPVPVTRVHGAGRPPIVPSPWERLCR